MNQEGREAKALLNALAPLRRRMRLQRTAEWAAIGLLAGVAGVLLLRAASFLWAFPTVWAWSAATLAGMPGLLALGAWLWPVSAMDAARGVDAGGLQARAQTALMLRDSHSPMADLQRADTLRCLETVQPKRVFPLRAQLPVLVAAGVCAALFGLSFLLPNPQESVLAARAAFQQDMKEQARLVDEGAARLSADAPQTQELRKLLSDLALELRKAEEPRAALGAADEAERRIESLQNTVKKDALNALQKSGMGDLKQALEEGDGEKAEQLLRQQSAENAAEALSAAANAAADATAQSALSAAAQAMLGGNAAQALAQLQAAASGQSNVTLQASALSAMVRIAAASAGRKQASLLAAAGMPGGNGKSGSLAGLALGMNAGAGNGAGNGTSDQDGGYHTNTGLQTVKGKENKTLKVEAYESVYDPTRLGRSGDAVQAGGKVNEGEIMEAMAGTGLGSADGSVPYDRVLAEYEETAVEAARNASLPAYARKWVADYFGALAE